MATPEWADGVVGRGPGGPPHGGNDISEVELEAELDRPPPPNIRADAAIPGRNIRHVH